MPGQLWVPGPVEIFIGDGSKQDTTTYPPADPFDTLLFAGWSDAGVGLNFSPEYEALMSDQAGARGAFDLGFHGAAVTISFLLTVFDEAAVRRFEPNPNLAPSATINQIGSLMKKEKFARQLVLVYPYHRSKTTVFPSAHVCWNFYSTVTASRDDVAGTRGELVRIVQNGLMRFYVVPNSGTGVGAVDYRALLYSNTIPSGLPTPSLAQA